MGPAGPSGTLAVVSAEGESPDPDDQPPSSPPVAATAGGPRSAASGSMLAAAMLAVGRIIEPQNTDVEITAESPSGPEGPDWLDLDFGDLPEI